MKVKNYLNEYIEKLKHFLPLKNIYFYNKFKIKFFLRKVFVFNKIIYLFIFFIFFQICQTNRLNKDIKTNYYFSYTKYKIYNRIKKKKSYKNIKFGIYIPSLSNGGRERMTALLISHFLLSNRKI